MVTRVASGEGGSQATVTIRGIPRSDNNPRRERPIIRPMSFLSSDTKKNEREKNSPPRSEEMVADTDETVAQRRFNSGRAPRRLESSSVPLSSKSQKPVLGTPVSSPSWAIAASQGPRLALDHIDPLKHERHATDHADDPDFILALKMAKKAAELLSSSSPTRIEGLPGRVSAVDAPEAPACMSEDGWPRPPKHLPGMSPPPPRASARNAFVAGAGGESPSAAASSGALESCDGRGESDTMVERVAEGAAVREAEAQRRALTDQALDEEWELWQQSRLAKDAAAKLEARRSAVDWLDRACEVASAADDWPTHVAAGALPQRRSYVPRLSRPNSWSRGLPRLSRAGAPPATTAPSELPRPTRRMRASWSRRRASHGGSLGAGRGADDSIPEHGVLLASIPASAEVGILPIPPPPPPRRSRPLPSTPSEQTSSASSPLPTGDECHSSTPPMRRVPSQSNVMLDLMLPPPGMPPPPPPRRRRMREVQTWL